MLFIVKSGSKERLESLGFEVIPFETHTYKEPANEKEAMNVKVCREIDRENERRREANTSVVNFMNPLIKNLFEQPIRVHPPLYCYAQEADTKLIRWISDPEVRLRHALKYLYKQTGQVAVQDYPVENAAAMADKLAFEKEIVQRMRGNISVRCDGEIETWDGASERTDQGTRVRWKKGEGHSFLRPVVITETY